MKKLLITLLIVLFAATAFGYTETQYETVGTNRFVVTEKLVFTADVAGAALPIKLRETYLFQIEVLSSADTSVAVTINSEAGAELYALSSGDYTTANIGQPSAYWWIHETETPTITIAGLGSGTITVKITGVYR